jgi:putative MATE family efflux protein
MIPNNKNKFNVLEGNLTKTILILGWPIALSSVIQTFYNLVDAYWLGKLGRAQLSAPFISFQLIFFIVSFAIGFATAGTSLVAQYTGAKDSLKARKVTGQILVFLTGFVFLLSFIGYLFATPLLNILKTPSDAFSYTQGYLKTMLLGLVFSVPFFVYQGVLNGYGDTKSPLKVQFITVILNLILDPIMIFGWLGFPAMGVVGAAIATIISRSLASVIGIYELFSGKRGINISLNCFIPDLEIIRKIIKIGLPVSFGMAGSSLGFIIIQGVINTLGSAVVAAAGIGFRMVHLFMLPALGISAAITTIVGQSLGADKLKRAKDSVIKGLFIILGFLIPTMFLTAYAGKYIMIFFIPHDPLVQNIGRQMFYIVSPSVIFFAIFRIYAGVFQGSGHTMPVMISSLLRIWLVRLPLLWLFIMKMSMGHFGVWWSMLFSNIFTVIFIFILYLKGSWQKPVIKSKISQKEIEVEELIEDANG